MLNPKFCPQQPPLPLLTPFSDPSCTPQASQRPHLLLHHPVFQTHQLPPGCEVSPTSIRLYIGCCLHGTLNNPLDCCDPFTSVHLPHPVEALQAWPASRTGAPGREALNLEEKGL